MAKKLDQCRTHDDFIAYGQRHGGTVKHGGAHDKIYGPEGGFASVPRHPGDIPSGTRRNIIKTFILIGLGILLLALLALVLL